MKEEKGLLRSSRWLIAFWFCIGTMTVLPFAVGAANLEELLSTGGMETHAMDLPKMSSGSGQLPDGWALWGMAKTSVVTSRAEVHDGKQAVRLEPIADTNGVFRARLHPAGKGISAQPGVNYCLTAWVRGQGTANPFVWAYSASGVFIGHAKLNEGQGFSRKLTSQWEQLTMFFTFEDDDTGLMIPGIEVAGQGSWMLVDDLSLTVDREKFPAPPISLLVSASIQAIGGQVRLLHNGRVITRTAKERYRLVFGDGENVLAMEVKGAGNVTGTITPATGGDIFLDGAWKMSTQAPEGWAKPGFDDTGWTPATVVHKTVTLPEGDTVYLRRSLYWLNDSQGGWLLGNPREVFIPQGGCVYLRAALRSPTATPVKDYRLVITVPAFLRLLKYDKSAGDIKDLPPTAVTQTDVKVGGQPYRRYELEYPVRQVVPYAARIGNGWELQSPRSGRVPIVAIFFQMDGKAEKSSYPITVQRVVNGNAGDLPVPITLSVMPAFSGTFPKTIQIYYYSGWVFPYEVQRARYYRSLAYPKEVADAVWAQYSRLGANRCEVGYWGIEDKPAFQAFVKELKQSGVQLGFARLSGMNYLLGYLAEPIDEQKPSFSPDNEALKIVSAHSEVQCKFYSGSPDSIPPVWKPSVFFRWFDTKLLFDAATRARKPTMWCQQYIADGGKLYLDYWRERFKILITKVPVDFLHWDWEYANVGFSCFCERDLAAFRTFAKLPADTPLSDVLIAEKYPEEWMKFRVWQNAELMGHFYKMLKEVGLKFEQYSPDETNLIEGLDWTQTVGKFNIAFGGWPGANPDKWFKHQVDKADSYNKMFNTRMIGQLLVQGTSSPVDIQYPSRRMNEMLRVVAIMRGGVNPWVNLSGMENVNGVECFERKAIDVIVKYEPYFLDGARVSTEFEVKGLRSNLMDLAAFRLAKNKPVLLLAFNDSKRRKQVEITWKAAKRMPSYYDGQTGRRLIGKGKKLNLRMEPYSTAVIECR